MLQNNIKELSFAELETINGGGSLLDDLQYCASYAVGFVAGAATAIVKAALSEPPASATVSVVGK